MNGLNSVFLIIIVLVFCFLKKPNHTICQRSRDYFDTRLYNPTYYNALLKQSDWDYTVERDNVKHCGIDKLPCNSRPYGSCPQEPTVRKNFIFASTKLLVISPANTASHPPTKTRGITPNTLYASLAAGSNPGAGGKNTAS